MKLTIDLKPFIYALISFAIAFSLSSGFIQKYIHFEDVINEIAGFVIASTFGVICLFASIERVKKS